ncbi:MAG: DUF4118 domain-containing protein [Streptosporangiaceae bacterium]
MTHYFSRDRTAVLAGLLGPLAVAAILLPWRASWSNTNVALVLVVAVVAVAALGSRAGGAVAAVSAAAWFDFFFTRPYERFTIRGSADITTALLLLLAVGVAVSQLAARTRRLRVVAITDAGYLAQIHEAASMAKSAEAAETVVDTVKDQLMSVLDLEGCRFEYGTLLGHPPRLEPDGAVVTSHGRRDVEHSGFPAGEIELRTFGNGQYYGRFMMRARSRAKPSLQARLVAVTLADQAGRPFGGAEAGSRA